MIHVFSHLEQFDDGTTPWCDMTFEIVEKEYDQFAASWRLAFRGDATPYEPVGFAAVIPVTGWHEQIDGEGEDAFHSFWGPVTLLSRGDESDRLIALMADYPNVPDVPSLLDKIFKRRDMNRAATWKFADKIECLAVGIASNPALIADEVIHMKLFFDDGVENGRYAEVFFNVDLPRGLGFLNEKDNDYRTDLVHWLSLAGNVIANPNRH